MFEVMSINVLMLKWCKKSVHSHEDTVAGHVQKGCYSELLQLYLVLKELSGSPLVGYKF